MEGKWIKVLQRGQNAFARSALYPFFFFQLKYWNRMPEWSVILKNENIFIRFSVGDKPWSL